MRELFELGSRLRKCASFVPVNTRIADIGTDHGYLPIWLLKQGIINSAIAADINIDPLNSAKNNSIKYNVELETILSNGFEKLPKESFDTAIIAGMGGELIATIIENSVYIKNSDKTLILQSMSNTYKLREYLYSNNFMIIKEESVFEKGKIYSVMMVKTGKNDVNCPYMGAIVPKSEYSKEYAEFTVKGLVNKCKGLKGEELLSMQAKIDEIKGKYL
ncbi:MAG: class I SAM-dependent methyltransferase [Clostridia bacterium]